jgi:hypothetical protein
VNSLCTGTGGSNWLRTIIPELVDDGVVPPKVVAGSVVGLGAVVTFEPSGMVDGGFAVVRGDAGAGWCLVRASGADCN